MLSVIESHGLSPQMYADDTQVYGACRLTAVVTFTSSVSECVESATSWMTSNRLQPNPHKTRVLWCATTWRQHQLPNSALLTYGCSVSPVRSARDMGIFTDFWLWSVDTVARLKVLRLTAPTSSYLPFGADCHVPACWWSRRYRCTGRPAGLPDPPSTAAGIQRSSSSYLPSEVPWPHHPSPVAGPRAHTVQASCSGVQGHGGEPSHLGPLVRVADLPGRRALRSAGSNRLVVPPVKLSTVGSRSFPPLPNSGTACLTTSFWLIRCLIDWLIDWE